MKQKAFTLVELLVIIAIIGILSSFIYVQTNNAINSGKDSKRKSDVALLASGVHVYSIGSDLPISSPCNIGSTCSSEIDEALIDQLGPLPADPDSDKAYIYQSDGTDCTISSVLSDGQTYQYDCSDDAMTQSEPISGVCGSSGGAGSYTIPTTNFCSDGYIPTISGTGPWTWSCPGSYLGSSANCTGYKSIDGQCDSASDGTNTYTAPASNLCTTGDATSVSSGANPTGYFTWACNGQHGGLSDSCSANLKVDGVCGASNNQNYYTSSEITDTCSPGTASAISGSGDAAGYFTWNCAGVNEGVTSETCMANKKENGQCGSASGKTYTIIETSYGSDTICTSGTYAQPSFPTQSNLTVSWTCSGTYGGTAVSCSASMKSCSGAGGSVTSCGGTPCCLFGSSCPSGWSQYGNWSTTTPSSAFDMNGQPCSSEHNYGCWYSSPCPSVGGHSWNNIAQECCTQVCQCMSVFCCEGYYMYPAYFTGCAPRTQIGCY
ncbi:MAG: type II secretion system protein [Candidatus Paceibacterota bacterium]